MVPFSPSVRGASAVGLFIAGLPSQVDTAVVLDYFQRIARCFSLVGFDENSVSADRQVKKGCCSLVCHDADVARSLLDQRFLSFMGRTLTVMQQKSGVELIIQNKKLKKSRVNLKKVPWYLSETELRFLLESNFGPLQLLYQLRNEDPRRSQKSKTRAKGAKFFTFSAYFLKSQDAKNLLNQGAIQLADGSLIIVQKHSGDTSGKQNSNYGSALEQSQSLNQLNFGLIKEAEDGLNLSQPITKAQSNVQIGNAHEITIHQVKPTHKGYYTVEWIGSWRIEGVLGKTKTHYRINRYTPTFRMA